ncbi:MULTISPECIES: SDR family NAD(P)-dependent oxidoreductase [unclassified Microbacterium]|uniref:SDR family NAD(P)-dependent oxidoreductase n=1 Tax=unclassified Microbacterium TaxID=2609290 RepID=UPI001605545E|nr:MULTISPECIES: SDR family NAD(P)-dependent oxidoreductase [unclassified Microbacterium]QNA91874.1 SDR family NAD(P)-dependent oxidoreductase [Microbacterium sp. Se63.02b]QYM65095.1 SDR family NAD(P)-dependent oxidoreductase [Microbacterium sp. Se5.02b]
MEAASPPLGDLRDRTVLVTGANAGIGYWCAEQLARRGARVILGCRSSERAHTAEAAIRSEVPDADLRVLPLDLGALDSVAQAAADLGRPLDAVVCNAGVKAADPAQRTGDGFDLMVGTNFLGHFALIAHLEPLLTPDARVVAVGSLAHRFARLDPARIEAPWRGSSLRQYGMSKAALMAFAFELARRWSGSSRTAACAHPGYAVDPLTPERPGLAEVSGALRVLAAPTRVLVQGKDDGALPIVHATASTDVSNGDYWGPGGLLEFRGAPTRVAASDLVRSPATGAGVWAAAERLTGVRFPA